MRPIVKPRWPRKPRDSAGHQPRQFEQAAADLFDSLQAAKVRIATRDLKIAAISLATNALLLTANRRDFEKVPGLRFENWLE